MLQSKFVSNSGTILNPGRWLQNLRSHLRQPDTSLISHLSLRSLPYRAHLTTAPRYQDAGIIREGVVGDSPEGDYSSGVSLPLPLTNPQY